VVRIAAAAGSVPEPATTAEAPVRGQGSRRVTFEAADGGFVINIPMEGAPGTTLRRDRREILVSFPHALPSFDANAPRDKSDGLVEGVSVGYDTMLLRLAAGVSVTRTDLEGSVRLLVRRDPVSPGAQIPAERPTVTNSDLVPTPGGSPGGEHGDNSASETGTSENKKGALRLRLLGAQMLAGEGQFFDARETFGELITAMPESPEPISGLAGVQQRTGRWRQALELYREARQLDPEDPSVAATIASIERSQARRLRTDLEYRRTDGGDGSGPATAVIEGISGEQPLSDGWRVGFSYNLAQVNAAQVQRANGTVAPFVGQRQRGEFFLQHDSLDGTVAAASAYMTGDTPGIGVRAELPDDGGATFLRADYRRPNWDFFQSMVSNGTRDRIAAGRRQQITETFTVRLDVGMNRYNLEDAPNLATTATVTAEARLRDLGGIKGLSAAYVLDGEYILGIAERTGPTGTQYTPLQIVDREVHAVYLAFAGELGREPDGRALSYELSAGYGVDRYGKPGPILAAKVSYALGDVELGLRAGYVRNIGRSPGSTAIVASSLTWFF